MQQLPFAWQPESPAFSGGVEFFFFPQDQRGFVILISLRISPCTSCSLWCVIFVCNCADHVPIFDAECWPPSDCCPRLPGHRADPGDMIIAMEIQSGQSPGSLAILSAATLHHQPSLTHTAHATHTHTHTDNEPFDSDRRCVNLTCSSFTTETQNSFR